MTTRLVHAVLLFLITSSAAPGWAEWSNEFGPTGLTTYGHVAAVVDFDGQLVAAGEFRMAGRDSVANIARWDGEAWLPFGNGLRSVECLAVHNGRLIAGGRFKARDEVPADGVVFWDGEAWQACSTPLRGEVYALAVYRGDLIVGGRFTIERDTPIRHIARWDGETWAPLGAGLGGGGRTRVEALELHDDELVVAGAFGHAGGVDAHHIARWTDREWLPLGSGADDVVNTVKSAGDLLYAAGRFQVIGGDSISSIAAWDGSDWSALRGGISPSSVEHPVIRDLEIWRDNLIAAGEFNTVGGTRAGSIATWDGHRWHADPPGFVDAQRRRDVGEVFDLALYDGRLVAAGKIRGGPGYHLNGLGLWDGERWDPLVTGQGADGAINEMKLVDGRLLVESSRSLGTKNIRGLATWADGGWSEFEFGSADSVDFRPEIKTITEHRGETVAFGKLFGGMTSSSSSQSDATHHLAAWNGQWRILTTPLEHQVLCVREIVSAGDSLLVLGSFGDPEGNHVSVVVWDGRDWREFDQPDGADEASCTASVAGRLYASWNTRTEDAQQGFTLAERNGDSWHIIKSGVQCRVAVLAEWEGRLVAAFHIPHHNSSESHVIQQWEGDQWSPLPGIFSYVYANDARVLHLAQYDEFLVASGHFNGVDSLACDNVAFWDGKIWRPIDRGVAGEARHLVSAGGSLWLSGGFSKAGGVQSRCMARWDGPLPVDTPVESIPSFAPIPRPTTRRGDGWHSHALDMTYPPESFVNGDFSVWPDSLPDRWEWRVGRRCSLGSVLPQQVTDGLLIEAEDDPYCLPYMAQRFSMVGGRYYRVRARYEMSGEPAGSRTHACRLTLGDYRRDPTGYEFGPLHTRMWVGLDATEDGLAELILRAQADADVGVVSFNVRAPETRLLLHEVAVDTISMTEDDVTELFISEMQEKLVVQSDHHIDWGRLRQRFMGADSLTWDKHDQRVTDLLRSFKEGRVTLESGSADVTGIHTLYDYGPVPEEDRLTRERIAAIRGRLMDWSQQGPLATGWTPDGIVYASLRVTRDAEEAVADLATAEGILLDLRAAGNDFGHSRRGGEIDFAGWFTQEPVVYGYLAANDGTEDTLRVQPMANVASGIPIVCLIGEGCVGDGAELAMMMKALTNVTLVGRPTRGGTGGMARFTLPTGSHVNYPARKLWTPDGNLVNDSHGLRPDVTVELDGSLDPVFEEGMRIMRGKISKFQR
ncbi:MAG: hypothetical protein GY838_18755 [bacterium]|nr:hypothetical protein [bacterium]